ncbi:MAG TPA: methyltransferase domain-containing protein [Gemmatimonadales bacterium]
MTPEIVTITGIAAGGDGVGRLADGRAVFVPRTAPGERVRLRSDRLRVHRHYARGPAEAIETPGDARVTPACGHYVRDACGGCQLQHLGYDAQLAAKRAFVGDALRRIGKLDLPDPEIVEAVDEWRYRTKITLTAKPAAPSHGWIAGLHPHDQPGRVFPLADCHITDFRLMALWRELRQRPELLPPRLIRLTLRLDREGRRHVVAESKGEPWQGAEALRAALENGEDVICWWHPVDGAARVVAGPTTGFPATAFEHVNPGMGALARAWTVEQLGDVRGQLVWDLYGGIGDTAALLAARGAHVVSVDADEKAVDWARRRAAAHVRWVAGRAEDVLPTLDPPYAVVLNPPRSGLHWNVTLRLTGEPVPRVAYMSCDPATLARDLHRMSVNYRVVAVRAFDLFPQTAHVETVVILEAA